MLLQQTLQSFELGSPLTVLVIGEQLLVLLATTATLRRGSPWSSRVRKGISLLVPPETALLPAFPQCAVIIEQRDCGAAKRDVVTSCALVSGR